MQRPDVRQRQTSRRGPGRLTAGAVALGLAIGAWLVQDGSGGSGPPPLAAAVSTPAGQEATPHRPPPAPLPPSEPTSIRIPSIKVNAPLLALGLDASGHLDTPPVAKANLVGWYRGGAAPGSPGNAIMAGHADTRSGPAVFYRLGLLRKDDTVEVRRRDGRTAVFSIDAVRSYPKNSLPDDPVYGPTDRPELRIITCGGKYDRQSGYPDNVVVFAHLTATR